MQPELPFRQRQPLDLAISAARDFQSGQTGFIHYCYKTIDEESPDTIPIYENFLFALSLFRSRTTESITEAKSLLDKLLHFQNPHSDENHGNFPVYLHEYPQCRDRYLAVHLLPVIYWILKDFSKVLGQELLKKLLKSTDELLCHCQKIIKVAPAFYPTAIKWACSAKVLGSLLANPPLEQLGNESLKRLHQEGVVASWFNPNDLGDMLIGFHMVYPRLSESPWKPFWEHLSMTWHRPTGTYIGPGLQERHKGFEPQPTIYDLFLNHFTETTSYRTFLIHPYQLQGALIHPIEELLPDITYPLTYSSSFEGRQWHLFQSEKFAFSVLQQLQKENPSQEYRIHPMKIIWGDRTRVHTFVCQGGNSNTIEYKLLPDNGIELTFELPSQEVVPDRDSARDISFYVDIHDSLKKTIAGKAATTFQLGEEIKLSSDEFHLTLDFYKDKTNDTSQFFGHVMPGNRPAQMSLKGINRFKAFDYQVFLRAVERKTASRITTRLRM